MLGAVVWSGFIERQVDRDLDGARVDDLAQLAPELLQAFFIALPAREISRDQRGELYSAPGYIVLWPCGTRPLR
jgi:hypothetical protein